MHENGLGYASGPTLPSAERILRAAKHLFAKRGYEAASTMAIARAAATSQTQLVKLFGTKEGLLEAVFDAHWQALSKYLAGIYESDIATLQKLRLLVRGIVQRLDADGDMKTLLALELGRVRRKSDNRVLVTHGYLESCALMEALFSELLRTGQIDGNLRPEVLRCCLFGIIAQFWWEQMCAPEASVCTCEEILLAIDKFLDAMTRPPTQKKWTRRRE